MWNRNCYCNLPIVHTLRFSSMHYHQCKVFANTLLLFLLLLCRWLCRCVPLKARLRTTMSGSSGGINLWTTRAVSPLLSFKKLLPGLLLLKLRVLLLWHSSTPLGGVCVCVCGSVLWRCCCVRVALYVADVLVFIYICMCVCVNVGSIAVAAVVGKCRCRSMFSSVLKTRKCVCKHQHLWLQQDLQPNLHSFYALSAFDWLFLKAALRFTPSKALAACSFSLEYVCVCTCICKCWLVGRRRFLRVFFFGYMLFSLAVYLTTICWQLAFT